MNRGRVSRMTKQQDTSLITNILARTLRGVGYVELNSSLNRSTSSRAARA
jgi:hypothetical protein